jgi:uncharacterized repeat protein (TIGR03803 family)
MNHRIVLNAACATFLLSATIASSAQTFTVLANFDLTDGAQPFYMSMVQGLDGNFYGTTSDSEGSGTGVVFTVTAGGTLTALSQPCAKTTCPHGDGFSAGLVLASDGNFYGTANFGGLYNYGAIYKITPSGTLTTLHSFNGTDGIGEYPPLALGADGSLYGATPGGGANGSGSIFKITLGGTLTTLYSFLCAEPNCADGGSPNAGLVQGANGDFYGTTVTGGANNYGTVFKMTPGGTLTTLYSLCSQTNCADGYYPHSALVQGGDRNFYGTTLNGGIGGGTVFKITPEGTLTTLYSFCKPCTPGGVAVAGLVQGTDGYLYGTTVSGTDEGSVPPYGAIFRITPDGKITFLHTFNFTEGSTPYGGLVQGTDGKFYGTTTYGGPGSGAYGTVYSLSMGLGPFVKSVPTAGKVGEAVKILGTDLTGATGVTFNGTAAAFTVVSATEISATVPAGATTGRLQVTTPTSSLLSNVAFSVGP